MCVFALVLLTVELVFGVELGMSEKCEELLCSALAAMFSFVFKIDRKPKNLGNVPIYKFWKCFVE